MIKKNRVVTDLNRCWDLAVFDMRETPAELLKKIGRTVSAAVAFDEGGRSRPEFSYLIDTMPNLLKNSKPNIYSEGFLPLTDRRDERAGWRAGRYRKILVTFGGEDREGLTEIFADKVLTKKIINKSVDLTVILGPFFKNREKLKKTLSQGCRVIDSPESLDRYYSENDIVVTLFGLTAFEALYHGCRVVLFNPSVYHRKLSLKAKIPEIGVLKPDLRSLKMLLENPSLYPCDVIDKLPPPQDAAALLKSLHGTDSPECRFCGKKGKIRYRFTDRNYLFCGSCKTVFMQKTGRAGEVQYNSGYFFREYRRQYGKTYLDDFSYIESLSEKRLEIIRKMRNKGTVLDAGCAYGPFLSAAGKKGYICTGIDISKEAAGFVRENLGMDAFCGDLNEISTEWKGKKKFNIITMWFVLEHFKDPGSVIRNISDLLTENGVFAFSAPNIKGISSLKNMEKYLEKSPLDHYTLWSPSSAKKMLKKYGFKVKAVRVTGHHPDRFPVFMQRIFLIQKNAGRKALLLISRVLGTGDTFEVYAFKKTGR